MPVLLVQQYAAFRLAFLSTATHLRISPHPPLTSRIMFPICSFCYGRNRCQAEANARPYRAGCKLACTHVRQGQGRFRTRTKAEGLSGRDRGGRYEGACGAAGCGRECGPAFPFRDQGGHRRRHSPVHRLFYGQSGLWSVRPAMPRRSPWSPRRRSSPRSPRSPYRSASCLSAAGGW